MAGFTMTRVNLIDPCLLIRQHLLAEHREITRIPNQLLAGRMKAEFVPSYRMGPGHVKFFTTRLLWLKGRYEAVHNECLRRGYNVQWRWPDMECEGDWRPSQVEIERNITRLIERDPGYKDVLFYTESV